jgi:hypothetical protein
MGSNDPYELKRKKDLFQCRGKMVSLAHGE